MAKSAQGNLPEGAERQTPEPQGRPFTRTGRAGPLCPGAIPKLDIVSQYKGSHGCYSATWMHCADLQPMDVWPLTGCEERDCSRQRPALASWLSQGPAPFPSGCSPRLRARRPAPAALTLAEYTLKSLMASDHQLITLDSFQNMESS
jgi:hypothetical protein